jgi:hypothetical protein
VSTLDLLAWTPGAPPQPEKPTERKRKTRAPRLSRPTIDQRFLAFHQANPHVFREMLRLATARLDRGETYVSVKALWEELRTSLDLADDGGAPGAYKLNNDYTSCYSRVLIAAEPRLDGVIRTRGGK